VLVKFFGVPGYTYVVQRSTNLVNWTDLNTNTPTTSNLEMDYTDISGSPSAYFRLKWLH
jgi:hypothetical protein